MTADSDVRVHERRGIGALTVGLFLPAFAGMLHLQLAYMEVRHACHKESTAIFHLESAATLLLALIGGAVAYRAWAAAGGTGPAGDGDHDARSRFLGMVGLLLGGFFALAIVAQWLPVFFLSPCQ
jgi:hypothetical protein